MKKSTKIVGSLVSASMLAMGGAGMALAADAPAVEVAAENAQAGAAQEAAVEGSFAYTQDRVTANADIAGAFRTATAALCNSLPSYGTAISAIVIGGDVAGCELDVAEVCEDCGQTHVMACVCAANQPAGGSVINAEVTGVSVAAIAAVAGL